MHDACVWRQLYTNAVFRTQRETVHCSSSSSKKKKKTSKLRIIIIRICIFVWRQAANDIEKTSAIENIIRLNITLLCWDNDSVYAYATHLHCKCNVRRSCAKGKLGTFIWRGGGNACVRCVQCARRMEIMHAILINSYYSGNVAFSGGRSTHGM